MPDAVALHRYEFGRNPAKFYLVERNRLIFVSTLWGGRALVVLAPPLLGLELAMVALAVKDGWLRQKMRGWGWLLRNIGACWRPPAAGPARDGRCRTGSGCGVLTDELDTPLVPLPGGVTEAAQRAHAGATGGCVRRLV